MQRNFIHRAQGNYRSEIPLNQRHKIGVSELKIINVTAAIKFAIYSVACCLLL